MSYETYATEYKYHPLVETISVWPLDSSGEPKSQSADGVSAIFAEDTTQDLSGSPIGFGGRVTRVWVFVDSMPTGTKLAPNARISRADGSKYTITNCQLRAFGTRYVCDLTRDFVNHA